MTTAGQLVSPPTRFRVSNPARPGRLIAVAVGLAALFMIPWTVFLGYTLPRRYDARHWSLLWIGFDVILCVVLTTFAWLTWKRRQLMLVTAIITGRLLLCDAWFDVITSWGNTDHWVTVITALFAELPLAAFMFWLAYRVIRRSLAAYYALMGPGDHHPRLAPRPALYMATEPNPEEALMAEDPCSPGRIRPGPSEGGERSPMNSTEHWTACRSSRTTAPSTAAALSGRRRAIEHALAEIEAK